MSILVYSGATDDSLVIGQAIFGFYNVTFDHDAGRVGFMFAPTIPYPIDDSTNVGAFIGFFTIMLISALIAGLMIYCSLERKRLRKNPLQDELDQEAALTTRRASMARKSSIA